MAKNRGSLILGPMITPTLSPSMSWVHTVVRVNINQNQHKEAELMADVRSSASILSLPALKRCKLYATDQDNCADYKM